MSRPNNQLSRLESTLLGAFAGLVVVIGVGGLGHLAYTAVLYLPWWASLASGITVLSGAVAGWLGSRSERGR